MPTPTHRWKVACLQSCFALALALSSANGAHAEYNYTLTLSAEIHVKPGDVVNLPARLTNTGTQAFTFREFTAVDDTALFLAQFNSLTLDPGESFDFAYVSLAIHPDAQLGQNQIEYRNMGIQFPDDTRLLTGYTGPCCDAVIDPAQRTRIVVDTVNYASPLSRVSYAYPGYYSGGPPAEEFARIALLSYSDYLFADSQISPRADAVNLPILAVPEPGTWMMLGVGLGLLAARKARQRSGPGV